MADDGAKQSNADWPLPKFCFEVKFDGKDEMHFQEISGLDMKSQPIEYRAGHNKQFAPLKMPGQRRDAGDDGLVAGGGALVGRGAGAVGCALAP